MGSRDAHSHGNFHLKTTHVFPFSSIAISNQLRSLSQKEIGDKTFLFSFLLTYGRVSSHAPPSHPQLRGSQPVQRVNVSLIYTSTHSGFFSLHFPYFSSVANYLPLRRVITIPQVLPVTFLVLLPPMSRRRCLCCNAALLDIIKYPARLHAECSGLQDASMAQQGEGVSAQAVTG